MKFTITRLEIDHSIEENHPQRQKNSPKPSFEDVKGD